MGWSEGRDHRAPGLGGRRGRQGGDPWALSPQCCPYWVKRQTCSHEPQLLLSEALGKSFVNGKEHDVTNAVATRLASLESSLADGSGVEPEA